MPSHQLSYSDTRFFSSLILDYLEQKPELRELYHRFPALENFEDQVKEKQKAYPRNQREDLVRVLGEQYRHTKVSEATSKNLRLLEEDNTFTITTGHQLNLFTGPLYFLYKIISTINLAHQLEGRFPQYNFVPVFWMATEDHDFEEISFFHLHGKKFKWNPVQSAYTGGPVGEHPTAGLEDVLELLSAEIGGSAHAVRLREWFREAYLEHKDLSSATRYLANEIFGEYGLVIIDGNSRDLKKAFIPWMKKELLEKSCSKATLPAIQSLSDLGYDIQVNPREINLFYMEQGLRERIVEQDGRYYVHGHDISWRASDLLELLDNEPEKFSPNVLMRPLYQEVILPNLCYIGGGGEIAYWLELRSYFEQQKVVFPILLLRNSVLLQTAKQEEKRRKLDIKPEELFLRSHELINRKVRKISNINIDFSPQKKHLTEQFRELYALADQTDKSFLGAVRAQEVKQLKGLDNLEKRLLLAQRRKLQDEVSRITSLQNELFPNQGLQERHHNFSEFYLRYGDELVPSLIRELDPLAFKFDILSL